MTHGKIVNKQTGLEIPCKVVENGSGYLGVRIKGTSGNNTYYKSDWDFVADPPALPTEPGLYKATHDTDFSSGKHHLLLLTREGEWYWISPDGRRTFQHRSGVERFAETISRVEV